MYVNDSDEPRGTLAYVDNFPAEAAAELDALRARVAELEAHRDQLTEELGVIEDRASEVRHAFVAALDQVDIPAEARTKIMVIAAAELLMTAVANGDGIGDAGNKPEGRPHVESSDCWCKPTLHYRDPETGREHWIHHEPN